MKPTVIRTLPVWATAAILPFGLAWAWVSAEALFGNLAPNPGWVETLVFWVSLAASMLVSALALCELLRPTRLIVDDSGVRTEGLWRLSMIPWADVDRFVLISRRPRCGLVIWAVGFVLTDNARARFGEHWRGVGLGGQADGIFMSSPIKPLRRLHRFLMLRHRRALRASVADDAHPNRLSPG